MSQEQEDADAREEALDALDTMGDLFAWPAVSIVAALDAIWTNSDTSHYAESLFEDLCSLAEHSFDTQVQDLPRLMRVLGIDDPDTRRNALAELKAAADAKHPGPGADV